MASFPAVPILDWLRGFQAKGNSTCMCTALHYMLKRVLRNSVCHLWMQGNKDNSMASFATVPMLDWLPRAQHGCSYSVAKYGKQLHLAPDNPDCGNGRDPRGKVL